MNALAKTPSLAFLLLAGCNSILDIREPIPADGGASPSPTATSTTSPTPPAPGTVKGVKTGADLAPFIGRWSVTASTIQTCLGPGSDTTPADVSAGTTSDLLIVDGACKLTLNVQKADVKTATLVPSEQHCVDDEGVAYLYTSLTFAVRTDGKAKATGQGVIDDGAAGCNFTLSEDLSRDAP